MKAKIIHVLCEGQTEKGFVDNVMKPYLLSKNVTAVKSILATTNKKLNIRGGAASYPQVRNDLNLMSASHHDGENERHLFTTMFDFYALSTDFPGYQSLNGADKYRQIQLLENAFAQDIDNKRFIPYIQLHEFEALVFCGINYLLERYPNCKKQCELLQEVLDRVGNPELINNGSNTAPSKRIILAIEGNPKAHYHYNKPSDGKYVTARIGMETLRKRCKHFNEWIERLIQY